MRPIILISASVLALALPAFAEPEQLKVVESPPPRHFFRTDDRQQMTSFQKVQSSCAAATIGHSFKIRHPMELMTLIMTFDDRGQLLHAIVGRSSGDRATDAKVLSKVQHVNYGGLLEHAPPINTLTCEVSMAEALVAQRGPQPVRQIVR